MQLLRKHSSTSNVLRVRLRNSSTGQGLTGLTSASSGLIISTICDNEAAPTVYTVAASNVETISTLATYAAPTASKCRFKLVDDTNEPGLYELQFANARFAVAGAKTLRICLSGATNLLAKEVLIQLTTVDPDVTGGKLPVTLDSGDVTGNVPADAKAISGDTAAADNLERWFDGTVGFGTSGSAIATSSFPSNFASLGINGGGQITGVVLVDTVTTLTNAPPDSAGVTTLVGRVTAARAGYWDNLNVGGLVASGAEVTAIQNNTRVVRVVPDVIERPDAGTSTYRVELFLYDETGSMEAPDSAPTIALVNQGGTDRSARLDSTTMSLVETGRYRAVYTADVADTLEQLVWTFSVVEGGATRKYGNQSVIVDTTAVDFTAADRTKLERLATDYTTTRAVYLDNLSGGAVALESSVQDVPTVAELTARTLAAGEYGTAANQATLLARLGAWTGTGVNTLLGAFKALLSKVASAPSDIGGTFNPATDSAEAISEAVGDIEGGGGGGGGASAAELAAALAGTVNVNVNSPVTAGTMELVRGDAYQQAEGTAISQSKNANDVSWPDTLDSVHLEIRVDPKYAVREPSAFAGYYDATAIECTVTEDAGDEQGGIL